MIGLKFDMYKGMKALILWRTALFVLMVQILAFNQPIWATNCKDLFSADTSKAISSRIKNRLGVISSDRTSFTSLKYPLVSSASRDVIQKAIVDFFGGNGPLSKHSFFSQFTINEKGELQIIVDPTVVKDSGANFVSAINKNKKVKEELRIVFEKSVELARILRSSLTETKAELAEVVLTVQVNKVSEGWHLDWYPQEYLIATQTFIAKKRLGDGDLVDEPFAGTEYLIHGDLPEVHEAMLLNGPTRLEFKVNSSEPVLLSAQGFVYNSPSGRLMIHSGVRRVHQALGIPNEAYGYSLVSPPHRGSSKNLVIRGSLAVRFQPSESEQ